MLGVFEGPRVWRDIEQHFGLDAYRSFKAADITVAAVRRYITERQAQLRAQ